MTIETYRNSIRRMQADLPTLASDDADFYASSAFGAADALRNACWAPHAKADGLALAAEFDALGRKAMEAHP